MRTADIRRDTRETRIQLSLNLDGTGKADIATGVGFLDHMLELFARHGDFDLIVRCQGDTQVDGHHSVEDIGICLGRAFAEALGAYFRSLVTTAFAQNLDGQLDTLAAETYTVSYNRISAILLTIPGVVDHTELLVGGGTENISVAADAVPVLTEVTVV